LEGEGTALAGSTLGPDVVVVHFDDGFANGEAEPQTVDTFRLFQADLFVFIENTLQIFLRDAQAGVCDGDLEKSIFVNFKRFSPDADLAVVRCELKRIADEIGQNLVNPFGVAVEAWQ